MSAIEFFNENFKGTNVDFNLAAAEEIHKNASCDRCNQCNFGDCVPTWKHKQSHKNK